MPTAKTSMVHAFMVLSDGFIIKWLSICNIMLSFFRTISHGEWDTGGRFDNTTLVGWGRGEVLQASWMSTKHSKGAIKGTKVKIFYITGISPLMDTYQVTV